MWYLLVPVLGAVAAGFLLGWLYCHYCWSVSSRGGLWPLEELLAPWLLRRREHHQKVASQRLAKEEEEVREALFSEFSPQQLAQLEAVFTKLIAGVKRATKRAAAERRKKVKEEKAWNTCFSSFSPHELARLEQQYAATQYPQSHQRRLLAAELQLSEERVQEWFRHRRCMQRRQNTSTTTTTTNNSPQNSVVAGSIPSVSLTSSMGSKSHGFAYRRSITAVPLEKNATIAAETPEATIFLTQQCSNGSQGDVNDSRTSSTAASQITSWSPYQPKQQPQQQQQLNSDQHIDSKQIAATFELEQQLQIKKKALTAYYSIATKFSQHQLAQLEALFAANKHPDWLESELIAFKLQLSGTRVKEWFRHRQSKYRLLDRYYDGGGEISQQHSTAAAPLPSLLPPSTSAKPLLGNEKAKTHSPITVTEASSLVQQQHPQRRIEEQEEKQEDKHEQKKAEKEGVEVEQLMSDEHSSSQASIIDHGVATKRDGRGIRGMAVGATPSSATTCVTPTNEPPLFGVPSPATVLPECFHNAVAATGSRQEKEEKEEEEDSEVDWIKIQCE